MRKKLYCSFIVQAVCILLWSQIGEYLYIDFEANLGERLKQDINIQKARGNMDKGEMGTEGMNSGCGPQMD